MSSLGFFFSWSSINVYHFMFVSLGLLSNFGLHLQDIFSFIWTYIVSSTSEIWQFVVLTTTKIPHIFILEFVHIPHGTVLLKVYMIYVMQIPLTIAIFVERIWGLTFLSMRTELYTVASQNWNRILRHFQEMTKQGPPSWCP